MNHSNNYLRRKRNSSENRDSIDMKKDDMDINDKRRDYGNKYRSRHRDTYSPQIKRRPSYDSPRSYSRGYKDDFYYERERKSHYYERKESSEFDSQESSLHDVRRDSRDNRNPVRPTVRRRYNFLISLPKNYFRFIDQSYDKLYRQVN
jgi:hypothetical protein